MRIFSTLFKMTVFSSLLNRERTKGYLCCSGMLVYTLSVGVTLDYFFIKQKNLIIQSKKKFTFRD